MGNGEMVKWNTTGFFNGDLCAKINGVNVYHSMCNQINVLLSNKNENASNASCLTLDALDDDNTQNDETHNESNTRKIIRKSTINETNEDVICFEPMNREQTQTESARVSEIE